MAMEHVVCLSYVPIGKLRSGFLLWKIVSSLSIHCHSMRRTHDAELHRDTEIAHTHVDGCGASGRLIRATAT